MLVVLTAAFAAPARAARFVVGSHLAMSYLTSDNSDGFFMLNLPSGGADFLATVQPGFRLGALVDSGRHGYFADMVMSVLNSHGQTVYGGLVTGNYQRHFSPNRPFSGYLTVGVGVGTMGDDIGSFTQFVYGAGLGLNMLFGHGNGAGRVEGRIDLFDPTEDFFDEILAYSLRVGFDLYGSK